MSETQIKEYPKADGIPVMCRYSEIAGIDTLTENPDNPNRHPSHQLERLAEIIQGTGWRQPITVSTLTGYIVKGHGRYKAAKLAGLRQVPIERQEYESKEQEMADLIADNRIAAMAVINEDILAAELQKLENTTDFALTGFTFEELESLISSPPPPTKEQIEEQEKHKEQEKKSEALNLLSNPAPIEETSIFNSRAGVWQARKQAWLASGLKSEETREVLEGHKNRATLSIKQNGKANNWAATSIFDPVLCEMLYATYSAEGDAVLDPFAGGSVRGVIAAKLRRNYTGIDLRVEQVEANRRQADELCEEYTPRWISGDSRQELDTLPEEYFDFLLSCPPYADLEVYSKDPRDISNMEYPAFLEAYRDIIKKAFQKIKENSFAVWVIGEVRGKNGIYYNFYGDTIKAFTDAGFTYHQELILKNVVGTVVISSGRQMAATRRPAKAHQNVMVFVKGDAKKATARLLTQNNRKEA